MFLMKQNSEVLNLLIKNNRAVMVRIKNILMTFLALGCAQVMADPAELARTSFSPTINAYGATYRYIGKASQQVSVAVTVSPSVWDNSNDRSKFGITCPSINLTTYTQKGLANGTGIFDLNVNYNITKIARASTRNPVNGNTEYLPLLNGNGSVQDAVVYFSLNMVDGSYKCNGFFNYHRNENDVVQPNFTLTIQPVGYLGGNQAALLPTLDPSAPSAAPILSISQNSTTLNNSGFVSAIQSKRPMYFNYAIRYQNNMGVYTDGYNVGCYFTDNKGNKSATLSAVTSANGTAILTGKYSLTLVPRPAGADPSTYVKWNVTTTQTGDAVVLQLQSGQPSGSFTCQVPAENGVGNSTSVVQTIQSL